MREAVGDHAVLLVENRLEQPTVGIEARRIENRVVGAEKRTECRLEFLVDSLRAADEAHRRHPIAVLVESGVRRLHQHRIIGETEIVVGTQVEHPAAVCQHDVRRLWRSDDPLGLEQPCFHQSGRALREVGEQFSAHEA